MFTSIVVPLNLESDGDRALPVAAALAEGSGIVVELITVSSPGMPEHRDTYELQRRADAMNAECTTTVLHDNNVAEAIASFLDDRPTALVVMSTHARGVVGDLILGSVTEPVLARVDQPILLVGPRARIVDPPKSPMLVAGVDDSTAADAVEPVIMQWNASFGGPPPLLVEVIPVGEAGDPPESCVAHLAARLREQGVETTWEVAHAKNPATALVAITDRARDAMLVVASARWTDPEHPHFASLARRLTQRAREPVLIVRTERSGEPRS